MACNKMSLFFHNLRSNPPEHGWANFALPVTTTLLLLNTALVFVGAVINAFAVNPTANIIWPVSNARRLLAFYWCTLPCLCLIATTVENLCLRIKRLSVTYIVFSTAVALPIWSGQLVLWILCSPSTPEEGSLDATSDCLVGFYNAEARELIKVLVVEDPCKVVYSVSSLMVLYAKLH